MPPLIPDGVPVLQRGRHHSAVDGACLMEATALLAGQSHTDHPDCVHPLIAAVARIVNDAVSDSIRQELLRFAPAAAATASDDPRLVDDLTILVCERALPIALPVWAPSLRRAVQHAHRRRSRGPASISRRQLRQAEAAVRYAAASIVLATPTERDRELTALLSDCLSIAHAVGRPTFVGASCVGGARA